VRYQTRKTPAGTTRYGTYRRQRRSTSHSMPTANDITTPMPDVASEARRRPATDHARVGLGRRSETSIAIRPSRVDPTNVIWKLQ
jgi:hypothetical protein